MNPPPLSSYPGMFQNAVLSVRAKIAAEPPAPVVVDAGLRTFKDYAAEQFVPWRADLARRIDAMGDGAKFQLFTILCRGIECENTKTKT